MLPHLLVVSNRSRCCRLDQSLCYCQPREVNLAISLRFLSLTGNRAKTHGQSFYGPGGGQTASKDGNGVKK